MFFFFTDGDLPVPGAEPAGLRPHGHDGQHLHDHSRRCRAVCHRLRPIHQSKGIVGYISAPFKNATLQICNIKKATIQIC